MSQKSSYRYRDLSTLTRIFKVCLWSGIAICVASIWSSLLQIDLLHLAQTDQGITEEAAYANDSRQDLIAGIGLFSTIVFNGVLLVWVYFSSRNAHALGARGMAYSPGWAVAWFLIPIANLWMPYKVVSEIFRASDPEYTDDWHHSETPLTLPIWWMLALVSIFAWRSINGMPYDLPEEIIQTTRWSIGLDIVNIALRAVLLIVASTLLSRQSRKQELVADRIEAEMFGHQW